MGSVNLDNTGSGSAITLSSDGTSLLLDGTAVGGGGGDLITSTSFPSTGFTLTNSDKGKYYHMTGSNQTVTLPASSAISAGWYVFLSLDKNAVYRLDIAVASGDSWYNGEISTYSIYSGNTVLVVYRGGGEWGLIGNDYYMATSAYGSGSRPTSYGARAVAIGASAVASGNYTYAFGKDAYATGLYATAMTRSRASAASAFAAAIDTNSSSYGASGTNSIAMGKQANATGADSIAIGNSAQATGAYSISIGWLNVAGNRCTVIGGQSSNAGDNTIILGSWFSNMDGAYSCAIGGGQAHDWGVRNVWKYGLYSGGLGEGKSQSGKIVLANSTTDATQTNLQSHTGAASTSNQLLLGADNLTWTIRGNIIGKSGADHRSWEVKAVASRATGAASVTIDMLSVSNLYQTAGASAWDATMTVNTSTASLEVKVTGVAATTIKWVADIDTTEIGF